MWINAHRDSTFSYTDINFATIEEAEQYLRHERCPVHTVHFVESPKDGLSKSYHHNIWREPIVLTRYEGVMPDRGAGFKRKKVAAML